MKLPPRPPLARFTTRLAEMATLHLQATHLPHVRRYHAQSERRVSRGKTRNLGAPRKRWTLPLHLIDLSQLDSFADATKDTGRRLHFLDWGNSLLGIAEIQRVSKRFSLVSLSIGSAASEQHSVLERFFRSKVQYRHLICVGVPPLHFRALSYVNKRTGKTVILPLYSAIVRLQRGRRYTVETIQEKLRTALDHRLKCARESRG